jgi:hypothetical protein
VQVITIGNSYESYTFTIPKDITVPCGADITPSECGYATVSGKCGAMTVSYTTSTGCPQSGKYLREWIALRNGVPVEKKTQTITVQDCPTRGYGIINVPVTPKKLPKEGSTITPHVLVSDLDLPCELLTVVWTWGDGSSDTFKCDHASPDNDHCKFDEENLDTSATHTYTTAGVWKISVLIYGSRATYIPESYGSYEEGASYVRFSTQFVTFDPYAGSVSGSVTVQAQTHEEGYGQGYTCNQPWVRKGLVYKAGDSYQDVDCSGYVTFTLGAKYTKEGNYSVQADGTTIVTWDTCAGGLEFKSSSLTHLSLFADGHSAMWTGVGKYSLAPYLGDLPFTIYVIDGGGSGNLGDFIHFRLSDNSGNVLFDTDPCAAPVTDIKVKPARPNSYITPESAGITVANPTEIDVYALGTEGGSVNSIPVGLVVGIVIGLMLFIVGVSAVVYFLLARRQVASTTPANDKFVAM